MKPHSVLPYEVTIRATNPNTGVVTIATRTEYAYHALDAGMQAIQNYLGALVGGCSDKIEVAHIGPPMAFILAAQDRDAALQATREALNRALRKSREPVDG